MMNRLAALLFLSAATFSGAAVAEDCTKMRVRIAGTSMAPAIPHGSTVEAVPVACVGRALARGDIVLFATGADPRPVIKRVVALPGDRFGVGDDGTLRVDGQAAKTLGGMPYRLEAGRRGMIALYARDYNGVIPADTFLVMGEQPGGTTDSSRIGLVHRDDLRAVATGHFINGN